MPNGTYGGVRGRKTKVGRKLLRFPPTRFLSAVSMRRCSVALTRRCCVASQRCYVASAMLFVLPVWAWEPSRRADLRIAAASAIEDFHKKAERFGYM